jgi:hypothetical protein
VLNAGAWYLCCFGYAKSRTLGVQRGECRDDCWDEVLMKEVWEVGLEEWCWSGGMRREVDVDG